MENMSPAVNTSRLRTTGLRVTAFRRSLTAPLTTDAPKLLQNLFLLFVFTIPFEAIDISIMSGSLSLPKICGFLFFASYCFYYSFVSARRSFPLPAAVWWFGGYVVAFLVRGFYIPEELSQAYLTRLLTLVQMVALLWLASSLLEQKEIKKKFLLTYSIASVFLAVAVLAGLPGFSEVNEGYSGDRMTSEGQDPNTVAATMSLGVLMSIAMAASSDCRTVLQKLMCLGLSVPPLALVVRTGSRGGMAALFLGLFAYLCPDGRRAKTVQRLIATALVAGGIAYAISNDSVALSRWTATLEQGSLAGREKIFPVAAEMTLERPLFGWGPIEFFYELGQRTGRVWKTMDAHNLLLHLMLEVGLVGTIPFLVGLWLCTRAAWKGRSGEYGLLPLSLMVTTMVVNMSVVALNRKPMWLVLALALSAHKQLKKTT